MNILISNRSDKAIYEQIYEQIQKCIISGELQENAPLPSIRSLAKDLRISVITTKRAFQELERDGFIYTLPSKGSFVAKQNQKLLRENTLSQIEQHFEEVSRLAKIHNISHDELIEIFNSMEEL